MEMMRQALVECVDDVGRLREQVLAGEGTEQAMTASQVASTLTNIESRISACVDRLSREIDLQQARSEGAAQARSEGFTEQAIAQGGAQASSTSTPVPRAVEEHELPPSEPGPEPAAAAAPVDEPARVG